MSLQDLKEKMESDVSILDCETKNTISLYILYYILLAIIGNIKSS